MAGPPPEPSDTDTMTRAELVKIWTNDFGGPPPKGISTRLLKLSAAYNRQAEQYGGLKPATRKRLAAAAQEQKTGQGSANKTTSKNVAPAPGTRLVREWHGRSHAVDIHDGYVVYEGCSYSSLSAVARAITGARWSGPRFFGLSRS